MNTLERLQKWYASQCDGDWEHYHGISIGNLDNPGWMVTIDLDETELENKKFDEIRIDRSEMDWLICRIQENKFEGRAGSVTEREIRSRSGRRWR